MTAFASLIRLLAQHDVQYVVVGGAAATAHGATRLTQVLDIVYRRGPDNIAKLAKCLTSHSPYLRGAPPGLPFSLDAGTIQNGLNFTLTTDLAISIYSEKSREGEDMMICYPIPSCSIFLV
jgi:hypothetical protein